MGVTNRQPGRYATKNDGKVEKSLRDTESILRGHIEFGGVLGTSALMVGFPLLMWYMWVGVKYYDGQLPLPKDGQSFTAFIQHIVALAYNGAFPTRKAWAIYWGFFLMEMAFYYIWPGVYGHGKPILHEGGRQLKYFCNAYVNFYATILVATFLHVTRLFPLYTVIDELGSVMSVAILSGFINSILVYISAFVSGKTHRLSGWPTYDFFMGAKLNPRIGILDLKMFYEVRIPWYILFLITSAVATRQYETYGHVAPEVVFLMFAHFLYANAGSKGEQLIITCWDMYFEKLGFMLTFWNMVGVPFSYCHAALYLASHHPDEYHWNRLALVSFGVLYLQMERGQLVERKTFPQLPWQVIRNPKTIETDAGDRIMVDGWFGIVRKPGYPCDTFFALSWALITGFRSPFPWFYPVFFSITMVHRTRRDIKKCRLKYGKAWEEYEKAAPYHYIPYIF
ncbi:Delta(24(24(1)))-sterol reductase [Fusarium sp. LHS14.1]|nr:Delta(24(24(1)))-sterol reductase [Fusarium sp. LHS14.1]